MTMLFVRPRAYHDIQALLRESLRFKRMVVESFLFGGTNELSGDE